MTSIMRPVSFTPQECHNHHFRDHATSPPASPMLGPRCSVGEGLDTQPLASLAPSSMPTLVVVAGSRLKGGGRKQRKREAGGTGHTHRHTEKRTQPLPSRTPSPQLLLKIVAVELYRCSVRVRVFLTRWIKKTRLEL